MVGVALVVTLVLVLAVVWLVEDRVRPPLQSLQIRLSAGRWWLAALVGAATQLVALVAFFLLSAALHGLGESAAGPVAGGLLGTLAVLAYAPVAWFAVPSKVNAYHYLRQDLREAGAPVGVQRGLAWAGGPVAVLGLGLTAFVVVQLWE